MINKNKSKHTPSTANAVKWIGAVALLTPFANAQDDTEIFELSPFSVEGTEETGYRATSTLAGTRVRTNLKDVGSAISVMTEEFMKDTNSNNAEALLVYAPSTEVAGQGGNFSGQGDGAVLDSTTRTEPVSNSRVRGLAEANNTRNFYLSDIPWDGYNVDRIDLQRGPNAILFGIGSPAGIINAGLTSASFKDENEVSFQLGSFGSKRFEGSFNKVLLEDELAFRLALLRDETDYRQDPAFRDDERIYAAMTWKPSFLSSDNYNTEITLNYENGSIDSNNPRQTPPLDAITPWFDELNKATFRGEEGATINNPWIGAPGQRVWDGVVTNFDPEQGISHVSKTFAWPNRNGDIGIASQGNLKGISTYNVYAGIEGLPGSDISAHKAKSLTDPTIFDFYNKLLEGPNKSESNDFDAISLALRQNFFGNKLGYELAYDKQDATWGYQTFMSGDAAVITVDILETLVDGSPNPNVGRPFTIGGGGSAGGFSQTRQREVLRGTLYGELDFSDMTNERLGGILGKHTFTGLLSTNTIDSTSRNWTRTHLGDGFEPNNENAVGQASRDAIIYSYLGANASGSNSASGLNIDRIRTEQNLQDTNVRVWNNDINEWQTVPMPIVNANSFSAANRPYRTAALGQNKIDSKALVWQGRMFGGNLIPMIGWREDKDTASGAGSAPSSGGLVNVNDPTWRLPNGLGDRDSNGDGIPDRLYNSEKGESLTKSIVVHAPKKWFGDSGYGFSMHYSESENFQPDASRIDVFGNAVSSPFGTTKDYGFTFSAFEEKLIIKVNKYKTSVFNSTAGNSIGGNYLIGAVETWGQKAAIQARDGVGSFATSFGMTTDGNTLRYRPDGVIPAEGESYTQMQIDETYAIQEAAITSWLADPVSSQFQTTWAMGDYANGSGETNFGPAGLVVTSDTLSEGTEIELMANLTPNLSIVFNATKTSAQRANLAAGYVSWVDERWEDFQNSPQGDIRLWGPGNDWATGLDGADGETAKGKFARETISGLNLWKALENSNVPELVEWRYNGIVNYAFNEGKFKGLNVGGSFRYQEAPTVGFPVTAGSTGTTFDVKNAWKGSSETNIDLWVGYEMKLRENLGWRIQANLRNAFGDDELFAVTVQPDGSGGTYRIAAPKTWAITNTFTF